MYYAVNFQLIIKQFTNVQTHDKMLLTLKVNQWLWLPCQTPALHGNCLIVTCNFNCVRFLHVYTHVGPLEWLDDTL